MAIKTAEYRISSEFVGVGNIPPVVLRSSAYISLVSYFTNFITADC